MNDITPKLSRHETHLLQLFRASDAGERESVIADMTERLLDRVSAHPDLPSPTAHNEFDRPYDATIRFQWSSPDAPFTELVESEGVTYTFWGDPLMRTVRPSELLSADPDHLRSFASDLRNDIKTFYREHSISSELPSIETLINYIHAWREKFADVIERNATVCARVAVSRVNIEMGRMKVAIRPFKQTEYHDDSLEKVEGHLTEHGWARAGTVERWDRVKVALWSVHNAGTVEPEYLAVWSELDQPTTGPTLVSPETRGTP